MINRYSGVKSVDTTCRIMEAFSQEGPRLALKDLAKAVRMPPSKLHRYLDSLVRGGLIQRDPATRHYDLGSLAFEIGLRAVAARNPLQHAIGVQRLLRNEIDQSVSLSVWGNKGPTIVHVEESSQPIIMTMKVGAVLPILATATGLVFCAMLAPAATKPLLEEEFTARRRGDPIVSNREALKKALAEIRRDGYAINRGHLMPQICAIAVPYFEKHDLTAVLAVIAHERDIERDRDRIVQFVRQASRSAGSAIA